MCVAILGSNVSMSFLYPFDFLINWRTGSVCKGLLPSFTVLGNGFHRNLFLFVVPDLSLKDCRSLLKLDLLDATGFSAAFPLTRQGMHPSVALQKSTLRRMSLD